MKASIPPSLAFPRGFKDGKAGHPNLSHLCSKDARSEYDRGYAEGREHVRAKSASREGSMSPKGAPFKHRYPHGPRFTVHVSKTIMEHAKVRDSGHCMIQMAVADVKPEFTSVSADLQTIRMSDPLKGYRYTYLTPRIAQKALIDWDQGVMPEPYSFTLAGAHVTMMSHHKPAQTPRQRTGDKPDKADLTAAALASGGPNTTRPRRVGGRPPPQSNLGKRREFGLRAFKI
jgi:hypothetical protein